MNYRWMAAREVDRLKEIERTEQITVGYTVERGELRAMEVQWDVPAFFAEGRGEHTVAEQIEFCREHLQRGGRLMGAFEDDQLVGVGLLQPQIRPGMAQLAYLQVSQACRRLGIGTGLVRELEKDLYQSPSDTRC